MNSRQQIIFLLQVGLPFVVLGFWKHPAFWIFDLLILISLPSAKLRTTLITGWQQLGHLMGKIISPIVLSAIYYLGLTPLAYLRRLSGSDELSLKKPKQTNLKTVATQQTLESFDDLW